MIEIDIRPVWRLRTPGGGERDFDLVLLALLEAIERDGKLSCAAPSARISYRHAWNLIDRWSAFFGAPLVEMTRGRGTRLAPLGAKLLRAGQRVQARLGPELEGLAADLARDLDVTLAPHAPAIRGQASHDFAVAALREQAAAAGLSLDLQYRGSFDALAALCRGDCELAGFHLPEGPLGALVGRRYAEGLADGSFRLLPLAMRWQGLIVARGNPKAIASVADLARPDLRLINRQRGSGTRALLEFLLSEARVPRAAIRGYEDEEFTHASVAAMVAGGQADAGFGVEAAAAQFRLGFVPVCRERYFLACRSESLVLPTFRTLLRVLGDPRYRSAIDALAGYAAPDLCIPLDPERVWQEGSAAVPA